MNVHMMFRLNLMMIAGILYLFIGQARSQATVAGSGGTITYEPPVQIAMAPMPQGFGRHAVTRVCDWNDDSVSDLLIGGGDGRIWLIRNEGRAKFVTAQPVESEGRPLKLGDTFTTACLVDINGDQKPDLIVAHSEVEVSWLENLGTRERPEFAAPRPLTSMAGNPLTLPKGCGGRIDVADADLDGDADLVAGNFSGPITYFPNLGSARVPSFGQGRPIKIGTTQPSYSYNVHPTLFDVNEDGICDVAYGMNWGTVGFLMASSVTAVGPALVVDVAPSLTSGAAINLREIAGDDATPAFADLDGDGTLDIVSGGHNEKIFWLRGVPISQQCDRIEAIMNAHQNDLGAALKTDEALRTELIGLHRAMYRLSQGFLKTSAARTEIRDWYVTHIKKHPRWLKRSHQDPKTEPYVSSIAYQVWTVLMLLHEGDPDARSHRMFVADTIGFEGRLKEILVEYGTLIIENGRATPSQQECLYSYLTQIPPILLHDRTVSAVTEVISIGDYLGPRLDVLNNGGVNIFDAESGKPGSMENSFPKDFKPLSNDYFGLVLAHELNHRVDFTRFAAIPEYNQKYWAHMRKVSGPDVKFHQPDGIGVDWEATKRHFAAQKFWDGNEASWNRDWANYWLTGPGKSRTLNVCRNETAYNPPRFGIPFFLETRQEAIASLANQYFSSSEHMLEFALDRYRRGAPGCLDEWLLMADVYSLGGPTFFLYRHDNGTPLLKRTEATLTRDPQGNINSIRIGQKTYEFDLDAEGLVEKVR